MGTTLTGTTPQDTYDSLIKVTDNGPLSGSLKVLTDGLGNNSTLSLSTAAASIAGTLAVTGNATFDTNVLVVDATNNRVGVGLTAPKNPLHVNTSLQVGFVDAANDAMVFTWGGASTNGTIQTFSSSVLALNPAGNNVGIGTSSPLQKLGIDGSIVLQSSDAAFKSLIFRSPSSNWGPQNSRIDFIPADGVNAAVDISINLWDGNGNTPETLRFPSSGGLRFPATQVASANANTLDDYEEGTWTMGVSFGGLSVGVTTSANTGTYTKIGRQVTVNGYIVLTSKGSSTGGALITGLPFTSGNSNSNYAAVSIHFYKISFANQMFARVDKNANSILLAESTEAGVFSEITDTNFANDSEIMVLATYFV